MASLKARCSTSRRRSELLARGQQASKLLTFYRTSVTTKRGNEVSREGKPEDPAVVIDTGKSKAIKANHELN